jgi:hypothetical protein
MRPSVTYIQYDRESKVKDYSDARMMDVLCAYEDAGTSGSVIFTVHGDAGSSPEYVISRSSAYSETFSRGMLDSFVFFSEGLGLLSTNL